MIFFVPLNEMKMNYNNQDNNAMKAPIVDTEKEFIALFKVIVDCISVFTTPMVPERDPNPILPDAGVATTLYLEANL